MASSWISVESTSSTTKPLGPPAQPAGSTAMSTPVSSAAWTSAVRSTAGSAELTISSTLLAGARDSWVIDSMLPPDVGDALRDVADRARPQRMAEHDHVAAAATAGAAAFRPGLVRPDDRHVAVHPERLRPCGD